MFNPAQQPQVEDPQVQLIIVTRELTSAVNRLDKRMERVEQVLAALEEDRIRREEADRISEESRAVRPAVESPEKASVWLVLSNNTPLAITALICGSLVLSVALLVGGSPFLLEIVKRWPAK